MATWRLIRNIIKKISLPRIGTITTYGDGHDEQKELQLRPPLPKEIQIDTRVTGMSQCQDLPRIKDEGESESREKPDPLNRRSDTNQKKYLSVQVFQVYRGSRVARGRGNCDIRNADANVNLRVKLSQVGLAIRTMSEDAIERGSISIQSASGEETRESGASLAMMVDPGLLRCVAVFRSDLMYPL